VIRRLLERLPGAIVRRPGRFVVATVLPCLVFTAFIAVIPIDVGMLSMLDKSHPDVQRYLDITRTLELGARMIGVVEGPEDKLDAAGAALAETLEAQDGVQRVFHELPDAWLEANEPYLVPRPVFDAWVAIAKNPVDVGALTTLQEGLEELHAERTMLRRDGLRLIEIKMTLDPLEAPMGGADYFIAAAAAEDVAEAHGVTIQFAGMPAVGAQDQAQVFKKIYWVSPIGLLIVLLLLRMVERRPLQLAAVALPMVLSAGATVGLVGLLMGQISAMEAFFGVLIFGLGVDFAIHLMVRLREERARGLSFEEGLAAALRGAGPGIVAGGLTTAGAFAILAMAPDVGAQHLGTSGALGLLLCLVLMLTLLPALWVLLERRGVSPSPRELRVPGLARLARIGVERPWTVIVLSMIVAGAALSGLRHAYFETDLENVFSREVPALRTAERLVAEFEFNPQPWVVLADTLDEARRLADEFEATDTFVRAESLGDVFPEDMEGRADILRSLRAFLPVPALTAAAAAGPPEPADLPDLIRERFVAPDGRFVVRAYAEKATMDGLVAAAERRAAQEIHPDATGMGITFEHTLGGDRPWLKWVFLGILAFVVSLLAVDTRSLRWLVIAATPVLFGTAVCLGTLCWAGVSFNVMTTVVIPLLIGLGVDDGIHVVHRIRDAAGTLTPDLAAVSVGRAITMTTATTSTSTLAFLIADHPGLESLALVLIVGLPMCLLASVLLVPALTVVTAPRTPA